VYRKTLRLGKDSMVLEHRLKNTGSKPIATQVYNHNFFTMDRKTTGPDIVVQFPFEVKAARSFNGLAEARGKEIAFLRQFEKGQTVFSEIDGFGATAASYDFRITNRGTGASVRITGDRPLVKVYFWSASLTVCPEPYIDVSVEPGKESTWRINYQFSHTPLTVKEQP
jgi:galactose mutarotase-like enzyme